MARSPTPTDGLSTPVPRLVKPQEVQSESTSSFPHSFREYENSDRDGMLDEVHNAMALVAKEEYRHLNGNQDAGQGRKLGTTSTSLGAVVHQLLDDVD